MLIGNYRHETTSMCISNCDSYSIGSSHKLVDRIVSLNGDWGHSEVVLVSGDWVEVEHLPTIAGPQSRGVKMSDVKTVLTKKFKVEEYEEIIFGEVSVLRTEHFNYLNNKDAYFNVKFINPLDKEVSIKFSLNEEGDFQKAILKPKEEKVIKYKFTKTDNQRTKRKSGDTFWLVVINGFVDDSQYKKYYYSDIDERENNEEPMVFIEKFIDLREIIKL